jgi:hypothetical protein
MTEPRKYGPIDPDIAQEQFEELTPEERAVIRSRLDVADQKNTLQTGNPKDPAVLTAKRAANDATMKKLAGEVDHIAYARKQGWL